MSTHRKSNTTTVQVSTTVSPSVESSSTLWSASFEPLPDDDMPPEPFLGDTMENAKTLADDSAWEIQTTP